ncbi:NAD(P)-binding protein, partial [bacterium]|nr:NAD(P)-binding protein [bacterium]
MGDVRSVGILGAGISGLSVAHRLKKLGVSFILFESDSAVGGKIQTESIGPNLVEQGPNSLMLKDGKSKELLRELGLE